MKDVILRVRITWPRKVTLLGTVTSKRPEEAKADPSMRTTDLHNKKSRTTFKKYLHERLGALFENR